MLIPTEPADRKLSKIETLRLASSYINHLNAVLYIGQSGDKPCTQVRGNTVLCTFCVALYREKSLKS